MRRVSAALVCAVGMMGLAGCMYVPPFVQPAIPEEIQAMVDDPNTFTLPELTPDPNAPAVAEASVLTGYWGRTFDPQEIDTALQAAGVNLPGTRQTVRAMDLWHFDAVGQTVEYEMYARDEASGVVLIETLSGTFELREPGLVAATFDTFGINDWATGQMRYQAAPGGSESESLLRFQVEADHLFLLGVNDTGTPDEEAPWVYLRFDGP